MTPAERALLNEQTMLDTEERVFCGIELLPVTVKSQRYLERIVTWYGAVNGTPRELSLAYAFALSLPLEKLRAVAGGFARFEEGLDDFVAALPTPVPAAELERLSALMERDTAQIEAAQVEIVPKPGESRPDPDAPGNS